MKRYKNTSGDSGVVAYDIGIDFITVRFADGDTYRYTYRSTGRDKVESMKQLAQDGHGLSTFIARYVHDAYAAKLR